MNPETEVFTGLITKSVEPEELQIAHWKFDGSFSAASSGRMWLDDDGSRIQAGSEYLLTGGFKRWRVVVTGEVGFGEDGQQQWLFNVSKEIW